MAYQEIETNTWRPVENEFIEGELVGKKSDIGVNKSMLYSVETSTGLINVWGSKVLDERMNHVNIGDSVKITFKGLGQAKRGMNPPKIFKVEVDRE